MKLAILGTRGVPARYGGFETFAERLAVGLCERGFDVTVFCEAGGTFEPSAFQGVKLRYVSAPSLGPLQTILYDLKCLWAARRGYDVVYMLGYGAAPFCVIPRLWGTEVWINPDGLEWARAKWGFVAKNYFHLMEWTSLHVANRIIADAEAIESSLTRRHGKLQACTVIPYGCEVIDTPPPVEPLSEWDLVPDSYYLVVCRLEPENHVLEILQAFQRAHSNKQLIVLGNHFTRTSYVAQLGAVQDPRIRMIGTVYDPAKLTSLRYYSFAYMHGHSVGGTNPSLLEAMGCGNLIFAHDNPFNRETLGSCGYFFANDVDLTEAINLAEREPAELARLREAAISRARTNYRWPDIVSSYAALLEQLPRS
jgi:glycosyltransferase involved in cell wall biosynthesis